MATCKDIDSGSDQITQLCNLCKSNVSDGYCGECEEFMCQSCFNIHSRVRTCRHHVLLDNKYDNDTKKTFSEPCTLHPNQNIKYYCIDHELVGCVECFFQDHRNCQHQNIQDAAKTFEDSGEDTRLKREIQRLANIHSQYSEQYEQDKETATEINDTVVNDVKSFNDTVTSYVAKVEELARQTAERLRIDNETRLEKHGTELDSVGEEIELCMERIDTPDSIDELFIASLEVKHKVETLGRRVVSLGCQTVLSKYEFQPNKLLMEMVQESRSFGEVCVLPDSNEEEDTHQQVDNSEQRVENSKQPEAKLLVTNIPRTVGVDYIDSFFERERFRGLAVLGVVFNQEDACAIVELGSSEDVDAVLGNVPIKMKGKVVEVQKYEPEPTKKASMCNPPSSARIPPNDTSVHFPVPQATNIPYSSKGYGNQPLFLGSEATPKQIHPSVHSQASIKHTRSILKIEDPKTRKDLRAEFLRLTHSTHDPALVAAQLNTTAGPSRTKKSSPRNQSISVRIPQGRMGLSGDHPKHANISEDERLEKCVICMDTVTDPKTIKCGHTFCTKCIDQQFQYQKKCPTCGNVCGVITGDQPDGNMNVGIDGFKRLPGYEVYSTICITYSFLGGKQKECHTSPGKPYKGVQRVSYLPNNSEGRKILNMLKIAFERKLLFTIGISLTTGQEGVITYIYHKADHRQDTQFDYPDPTYLDRIKDQLAAVGVTEDDI